MRLPVIIELKNAWLKSHSSLQAKPKYHLHFDLFSLFRLTVSNGDWGIRRNECKEGNIVLYVLQVFVFE